jgi:hypothetical protein
LHQYKSLPDPNPVKIHSINCKGKGPARKTSEPFIVSGVGELALLAPSLAAGRGGRRAFAEAIAGCACATLVGAAARVSPAWQGGQFVSIAVADGLGCRASCVLVTGSGVSFGQA